MKNEEIINVVICYNNVAEVIEYYDEILSVEEGDNVGYVVVINASSADELRTLEQFGREKEHVFVFNPGENLGYMNGLLYGYRNYREQTGNLPAYVIMSNTDIAFQNKKFFTDLLAREYDGKVGCIGPSILVSELNSYDNPVSDERYSLRQINQLIRRFSTPGLREAYVSAAFIKPRFIKRKNDETSRNVYEVHGCFFVLTSEYAELIKNMKYGALLYSEELFVAENAYWNGYLTYYDAGLEIIHKEHSTTSKLKPRKRARMMAESMKWIRDTYYVTKGK